MGGLALIYNADFPRVCLRLQNTIPSLPSSYVRVSSRIGCRALDSALGRLADFSNFAHSRCHACCGGGKDNT